MDRHLEILLAFVIVAYAATAFRPDVGNEARSSSKRVVSIGNAETLQPPFKTLQKTDDYEEREYGEGDFYVGSRLSVDCAPQPLEHGLNCIMLRFRRLREHERHRVRLHSSIHKGYFPAVRLLSGPK